MAGLTPEQQQAASKREAWVERGVPKDLIDANMGAIVSDASTPLERLEAMERIMFGLLDLGGESAITSETPTSFSSWGELAEYVREALADNFRFDRQDVEVIVGVFEEINKMDGYELGLMDTRREGVLQGRGVGNDKAVDRLAYVVGYGANVRGAQKVGELLKAPDESEGLREDDLDEVFYVRRYNTAGGSVQRDFQARLYDGDTYKIRRVPFSAVEGAKINLWMAWKDGQLVRATLVNYDNPAIK